MEHTLEYMIQKFEMMPQLQSILAVQLQTYTSFLEQ